MSQSHGSNSQGLHTSVAGKLLFRKLIESKTFYIFTFSIEIQKRSKFFMKFKILNFLR